MQNFGGRGNEVTEAVNGELVRWTNSLRLLDTHPLEGVHHEIHSFLYHLHPRNHVWWGCFHGGWTACVLSLLSTWGIAAFWPFLVPSLSACIFLVLLLSVKPYVLLA